MKEDGLDGNDQKLGPVSSQAPRQQSSGARKTKGVYTKSFNNHMKQLTAYKAQHGHLNVNKNVMPALYRFTNRMRNCRRGKDGSTLSYDRIAALDAIGFDWGNDGGSKTRGIYTKSFDNHMKQLTAYKAQHGHLKVKKSIMPALYRFTNRMRNCRWGKDGSTLTGDRIAALDAIGFDWGHEKNVQQVRPKKVVVPFQDRVNELSAYYARFGHFHVSIREDQSLCKFCQKVRRGKKQGELTDDQIASLDAIGFDWAIRKGFDPIPARTPAPESNNDQQELTRENSERKRGKPTSFNDRVEQLKAYKAQHGHLKVKRREDASLGSFCHNIRNARNGKNKMAITSDHIAALDAIGFDWNPPKGRQARDTSAWELYKAEREATSGSNESRVPTQPMMVAQVSKGEEKIAKISRSSLQQAKAVATFQDRVNALSAYKARLGHFYVMRTED
jgi:hypothetical protein